MSLRDAKPVQDAMNNILNQQAETIAMRPSRPLKWWERVWVWWRRRRQPRRDPVPVFVNHVQQEVESITGERSATTWPYPYPQPNIPVWRYPQSDTPVFTEEMSREEFERHTAWVKYAALGITLTPEQAIAIERLVDVRITDERERCARIAETIREGTALGPVTDMGYKTARAEIAAMIRTGKDPLA